MAGGVVGAAGAGAAAGAGVAATGSGTLQSSPGAGLVTLNRLRSAATFSLGWAPTVGFDEVVGRMVDADLALLEA